MGGIGACSSALTRLGIEYKVVDYVEIDKYAVASFNAIHGTNFEPQDICKWDKDIDVDLIMHGSPCQDFSVAGKQAGGDKDSGTRSSLMYETIRIVEKLKPKYVIWENVKNLLSKKHRHNFDVYLEAMEKLGYRSYYQVLNAKDYGIPQNRERVFTVSIRNDIDAGFEFPKKQPLKLRLKDMLEEKVDEKYYLSDNQVDSIKFSTYTQNQRRIQEKDYCDTLCARDWKDPKCIQVAQMYGTEKEPNPQAGRIYDSDGISPTMDSCSGGNRMPKITVKNDGVYTNVSKQTANYDNATTSETELKCEEKVQKGNAYLRNYGSKGKLQDSEKICDTLLSAMGGGGGNIPIIREEPLDRPNWNRTAKEVLNVEGVCRTLSTQSNNLLTKIKEPTTLRIRKLTPKECWRLMGFKDEEFEKAQKIPTSNTQLYKQAGNSIVVDVLVKILKELLETEG